MPTKFVIFATVLCFIGMTVSADARGKGRPGTAARELWCMEQDDECNKAMYEKCMSLGLEGWTSVDCQIMANNHCSPLYGRYTSDCLTRLVEPKPPTAAQIPSSGRPR